MVGRRIGWLAVLAAVLLPGDADAAFPGNNGRIAFTSDRDGTYQIYSMNPDGSGQTRLTNDPPLNAIGSSWSPGGDQIASRCQSFDDIRVAGPPKVCECAGVHHPAECLSHRVRRKTDAALPATECLGVANRHFREFPEGVQRRELR